MKLRLALAGTLALSVVAATAAPGSARVAFSCAKWKAEVTAAGARSVVDYSAESPTGAPLEGTTLSARGHFFKAGSKSVLVLYGGVRYTVAARSVFAVGCSGQTSSGPAVPTLALGAGQIKVADPTGVAGAVITFEGLFGPVPGKTGAMTFTIKRKTVRPLKDVPSMIRSISNNVKAVRGITSVAVKGSSQVNVTPYFGPKPGTCVICHAAQLSSVGGVIRAGKRSHGGSAHYR